MTKLQFLLSLREKIKNLPNNEIEERLNFYSEMIEDRVEEGLSEEEAVLQIGSADSIAAQIIGEVSVKNKKQKDKRTLKVWELILIIIISPISLSLLIAAFAVVLALYIVLWALIISLWAVFVSLVACSFAGAATGILFICRGEVATGITMIGTSFICIGLSILFFLGCKAATKCIVSLTKKLFTKKEDA